MLSLLTHVSSHDAALYGHFEAATLATATDEMAAGHHRSCKHGQFVHLAKFLEHCCADFCALNYDSCHPSMHMCLLWLFPVRLNINGVMCPPCAGTSDKSNI
ncbi:unnamed protein product [Ostreobium quekettii]|uniref:Uncharacterized protein n=1 Tax=Ostreobium quekettii TaxID=121088 RepID=A0A8S1JBJ5_9CHLO|nr:unnamed protein product [Ostreobium quekettii]